MPPSGTTPAGLPPTTVARARDLPAPGVEPPEAAARKGADADLSMAMLDRVVSNGVVIEVHTSNFRGRPRLHSARRHRGRRPRAPDRPALFFPR